MQERWERILTAAERETNTQIAAYQQGRTDAMRAPQPVRPADPVEPSSYPGGQGPSTGYTQGTPGSGRPPATDPGDWRDPGTS